MAGGRSLALCWVWLWRVPYRGGLEARFMLVGLGRMAGSREDALEAMPASIILGSWTPPDGAGW